MSKFTVENHKIKSFLKKQGWYYNKTDLDTSCHGWTKENCCTVLIYDDEIVLIDDTGDFCHIEPVTLEKLVDALKFSRYIPQHIVI